ncbi:hypothetical protein RhiirA5_417183 [Rhizophagus irregularis]|uniref:Uncharacterized protein n=1 Tax=Rhizophagus irregularis TaxID=588596 RepID=A0A2I1EX46_9GLOM|nr:hypothetical protein RhiirA5_417183 [Rhizophagus irregularis]PKC63765.1 hypothetical protein RhiirA1_463304 [Rhizophagus irregularis]PKY23218.1 hypothetical protein RhiirB3_437362 [Rhizophagus irregularis]PKY26697.1 hypothetical protein RhiirB3_442094 [Rhizophagus irregularis]CAB4488988.1 unnamed protein product [Rhizophagus irregularis]
MNYIIYTTLNAFKESWPDIDTSVWNILAGRIRELLLCSECHELIFTNPQQKNITILTDRYMIHSVCLECPATKVKERNDISQIKASQDTKPSNHNSDMIKALIIKEQEALPLRHFAEPTISYLKNSTLHNNSQNDSGSRSRRNHLPLKISSIENDLISDPDIKQQTQDITNLQDMCSIEDISFEKALLGDREIGWRIQEKELSTSSHPISNNPVLSEQNAKIKALQIDIQPLIQELLIEPLEEDCVKVVNVEESTAIDQSFAIKLAYLYEKMKLTEIRTIQAKQDEIMSWYCYRRYFEKRHNEILPEILKKGFITNKKTYELASGQIYDEMLQHLSGVSRVNLRKKIQLTKPIYILFNDMIGENKIM